MSLNSLLLILNARVNGNIFMSELKGVVFTYFIYTQYLERLVK